MRRHFLLWLTVFCTTGRCVSGAYAQPINGEVPQLVSDVFLPEVDGVRVETWVQNLDIPWSLVFLPTGDALVSERRGRILRIPLGQNEPQLYLEIEEVVHVVDNGLMGLALHPQFAQHPFVYAMHGYRKEGQLFTRVIRLRHQGDTGVFDRVVLDDIPGAEIHIGGRIGFGPDGMLYVGTGDLGDQPISQDLESLAGKILRIAPDGQIPEDNPFPDSPIFSYGHRVVQGLAWDPQTGAMFSSEHGPSGEWPDVIENDEINIIEKGANYGWPNVIGAAGIAEYRDPIIVWRGASVPPAGVTFYRGDLFVATLRSQALIRIQFEDDTDDYKVARIERWFARDLNNGIYGRLRDVTIGPDGHLYVLTSNTDGRAELRPNDDKILRVTVEMPTAVLGKERARPQTHALHQNHPNPFNPSTAISFTLARRLVVELSVFDLLGRRVRLLTQGSRSAGRHTVVWDGTDEKGWAVGAGLYLYRLRTAGFVQTRKMVLVE